MRKTSDTEGKKLFVPKQNKKGEVSFAKLGKVRRPVFSEDGERLVGFVVKRPDIVGMIKQADAFLAFDAYKPYETGIVTTKGEGSLDDAAKARLKIDWDSCVMWVGMDVQTTQGKDLGYISDCEYDEKTGIVSAFLVSDGNAAEKIVGQVRIPSNMIKGYKKGKMVVSAKAAKLEPSGGVAGVAGEGYARAKESAKKVGKKAGKVASKAFDTGTVGLGKAIGKARKAVQEALAEPQEEPIELTDALIEEPPRELKDPTANETPKTYAPKKKRSKSKAKKANAEDTAKAVGAHMSKLSGMFSAFKDEFDKASK